MGFNKSSQSSSNQGYGFLKDSLGSSVGNVGQAGSALSALLGGNSAGLNAFQKATGFQPQLDYGLRGVTAGGAARGLLNSGSTQKSLINYGQMLSNQSAQSYIQNLLGLGQLGLGAGQIIGGAGQTSQGKSKGLSLGGGGGFGG